MLNEPCSYCEKAIHEIYNQFFCSKQCARHHSEDQIKNEKTIDDCLYYMNVPTGSVAFGKDWKDESEDLDSLVEVEWEQSGQYWKEMK